MLLCVVQVSDTLMSVASLTAVDMSRMTSIKTAPRIVANVVGRGADFGSADGQPDGLPVMQQVGHLLRLSRMLVPASMFEPAQSEAALSLWV